MKSTVLRTFKQIYTDKETQKQKEYLYQVTIIRDTEDYKYRILNVTSGTIWKSKEFSTLEQAKNFVKNYPNGISEMVEIELNKLY